MSDSGTLPRTVLIGMDDTPYSRYAFDWFVSNIYRPTDHVVVIYSVDLKSVIKSQGYQWSFDTCTEVYSLIGDVPFTGPSAAMAPVIMDEEAIATSLEYECKSFQEQITKFAEMMKASNVKGIVKSVQSSCPGKGIMKAADIHGADVIVLGSKGKGALCRTVTGSTCEYVNQCSHVPVIVCHPKGSKKCDNVSGEDKLISLGTSSSLQKLKNIMKTLTGSKHKESTNT